jgi:uncharacterized membrane protein
VPSSGKLTDECNLCLSLIKAADDKGIWQRNLRTKSGLPETTMMKCVKTLQGAKLVKEIRSIKVCAAHLQR